MGEDLSGRRIGNYRVMRLIGEGSMATVFEAIHEQIGRRAAIKVLKPAFSQDLDIAQRFLDEARAVNLLHHPGIVEIYDFGKLDGDVLYAVMEYLDGSDLFHRLSQAGGALEVGDALHLSRQIALAMSVAHEKGITHRDLKPANVMILAARDPDGTEHVKVLDFGIAKIPKMPMWTRPDKEMKETGYKIMGTLAYMAPEQCRGAGLVDHKADVYSLGIMLFEMLSGSLPFSAAVPYELLRMQIEQPPPALRKQCPQLPRELTELVHCMLDKEAQRRPAMDEVAEELGLHLSTPPLPGPPPPSRNIHPTAHADTISPGTGITGSTDLPVKRRYVLAGLVMAAVGLISLGWSVTRTPMGHDGGPNIASPDGRESAVSGVAGLDLTSPTPADLNRVTPRDMISPETDVVAPISPDMAPPRPPDRASPHTEEKPQQKRSHRRATSPSSAAPSSSFAPPPAVDKPPATQEAPARIPIIPLRPTAMPAK